MTLTERISSTTQLLFRLNEKRDVPPQSRRPIYFSMSVTLEDLSHFLKLLEASLSFPGLRTSERSFGLHQNSRTYKSIDSVRILADAGEPTDTVNGFFRVDNGRARLYVKIGNSTLRSDPVSMADLRIAVGRHEEIIRVRARTINRRSASATTLDLTVTEAGEEVAGPELGSEAELVASA